jgi:hypothetical protein
MANKMIWDSSPTPADVFATGAGLKNASATAKLVAAADVANGTALNTHADFFLFLHDFDDTPHATDYIEVHIVYKFGAGKYGDGEDGDVAGTPYLGQNTYVGYFQLAALKAHQSLQLMGIEIKPYDFRVVLQMALSHDLSDENDHYMQIATYCLEAQ